MRVHTDAQAQASAQSVNSLAYSVGNHIVFGPGRYAPSSAEGDALLAHELAHVVQQGANDRIPSHLPVQERNGPAEIDANRAARGIPSASRENFVRTAPMVAPFSDTGHHVIEAAGLAGAGFGKDQIPGIERGNIERDYSQVGVIGNAALLCSPHDFGGYKPEEHFDNYMWDAVTNGWRTRGASALGDRGVDIGKTPIDYISSELESVEGLGIDTGDRGLVHLGNAFHTVEDFFAHSNFVEMVKKLTPGDITSTTKTSALMTGNLVGESPSIPRTLEAITPAGIRERYRKEAETDIDQAIPGSHTAMAHDEPNTNNYALARRLAALVIQDLGVEILAVMKAPPPQRSQLMKERVVAKVVRYLRPPDPQDKWWEALVAADKGEIDRRLDEAARTTPVTVNQCALSPLKNIEASQDSAMAIPLGVAIPTVIHGNTVWFQAGFGVTRQMPFQPVPGVERDARGEGLLGGAQITGRF